MEASGDFFSSASASEHPPSDFPSHTEAEARAEAPKKSPQPPNKKSKSKRWEQAAAQKRAQSSSWWRARQPSCSPSPTAPTAAKRRARWIPSGEFVPSLCCAPLEDPASHLSSPELLRSANYEVIELDQ
eukprot:scaffold2183_cov237-Pinguiococcus_pyrenoidosus.AAC.1